MLTKIIQLTDTTFIIECTLKGASFRSEGSFLKEDIMKKFDLTKNQFKQLLK